MENNSDIANQYFNIAVPDDWEILLVEELVNAGVIEKPIDGNHGNIHPTASDFVSEGIPFIMANNVQDGRLDLSNCNFIRKEQADKLQKGFAKEADVLLTHKGTVGNTAIVENISTDYIMLTPQVTYYRVIDESRLNRNYLKSFFESEMFQNVLLVRSGGGTRAYIGITNQRQLPIVLPPIHEQKAIANLLKLIDTIIYKTTLLISQKELRKKWLMQNLLTGRKRLKGFEGEWKEIHIRDVSKEVSIRNKDDKQLTVLSCTKYDGLVPSLEYFGRKIFSDDISTYKVVLKNHFAYATNHIEEGSIGYQNRFDHALISPMYTVFNTDSSINDSFFFRLLKSHVLVYQYQNRMEGSIDRRGGLRWAAFSIIKIKIPNIDEQSAISEVLDSAEKEIQLLKSKVEKLREQKKGMMQVLLTGKKRLSIF